MLNNPLTPIDVLGLARSIDTGDEKLVITAVTPVTRAQGDEKSFLVTLESPVSHLHVTVKDDSDDAIRDVILEIKELEPVRYAVLVIGPCLITFHENRPTEFVKNDSGRFTIDDAGGVLSEDFIRKALPAIDSGRPVAIRSLYTSSSFFRALFTMTAKEPRLTIVENNMIVQYEGSPS